MDWTWTQLKRKCDPEYTEFAKFNVNVLGKCNYWPHCWTFAVLLILNDLNDFKTVSFTFL